MTPDDQDHALTVADLVGDARTQGARESGQGILRAIDVLTFVASRADRPAPGVVEIARALGREKSVVSRNLRALADTGLLRREPVGLGYRIGPLLFTIAARAHDGVLTEHASEVVDELSVRLRERVDVLVRDGGTVVTIATAAPATPLQAIGRVGNAYPLLATAAGRCFLLDSPDSDVQALHERYGAPGAGPGAPLEVDEVLRRLRRARTDGFARADEEIDRSLSAFAVPVRGADSTVVAALTCAGPTERLDEGRHRTTGTLLSAARSIEARLGRVADGVERA